MKNQMVNFYVDPKLLPKVLEIFLNTSLKDAIAFIKSADIFLNEGEIREYLNESFESQNFELKRRLNVEGDRVLLEIIDSINEDKYNFDSETLNNLKTHINILKNKCLDLFDLIFKIASKSTRDIKDKLREYDISLDCDGNILKSDIVSLTNILLYHISALRKFVYEANFFNTYIDYKLGRFLEVDKEGKYLNKTNEKPKPSK